MRMLLCFTVALIMAGCGPAYILLANPRTKDIKQCSAREVGLVRATAVLIAAVEQCATQFEALGYVRVENLTPEQRSNMGIAAPKQ